MIDAQPFLKWAGGKRQVLGHLRARVPVGYARYYEPFIGGGALFFDLCPKEAIIGDVNEDLISTYRALYSNAKDVIAALRPMPNDKAFFDQMRVATPRSRVARAVRMIYLNKTCFNGLYRTNKAGKFNVPFGKYANPAICAEDRLIGAANALRAAIRKASDIRAGDFEDICEDVKENDFVYFDPPYLPVGKQSFTAYAKGGFSDEDHVRLRDFARKLASRGAHVLLSNADTSRARELYAEGFKVSRIEARRNINSKADGRGAIGEILVEAT